MTGKKITGNEIEELLAAAARAQETGNISRAKEIYHKLLRFFPDIAALHYNLGLLYFEEGEWARASCTFEKAHNLAPEDGDVLFNLALCAKKQGDLSEAVALYSKVLALNSDSVDALYNLGGCYKDLQEHQQAVDCYSTVLELAPDNLSAVNNLAFVYQLQGEKEQALSCYKRVLELNPEHPSARHMVATLSGAAVTGTPEGYVRDVFNGYATRYDESLVQELEYEVPEKIKEFMDELIPATKKFKQGLDLGCGTGLSGLPFTGLVDELYGVDLSPAMAALAEGRGIYRDIAVCGVLTFLQKSEDFYDFFLAADVLGYVGGLEDLFKLIAGLAQPGAIFCFSTEETDGAYADTTFCLGESGRFAHGRQYIEKLAGLNDFSLLGRRPCSLRKEKGAWVRGDLWCLVKKVEER